MNRPRATRNFQIQSRRQYSLLRMRFCRHVDLITVALNSVFALLCDHAPNSTTFGNRAYVHKDFKAIMDCTSGTDQDQRWYARRVEGAFR